MLKKPSRRRFVNVGMYDFQVAEDASLVREIVAIHEQRDRPRSA